MTAAEGHVCQKPPAAGLVIGRSWRCHVCWANWKLKRVHKDGEPTIYGKWVQVVPASA